MQANEHMSKMMVKSNTCHEINEIELGRVWGVEG